MSTVRGLRGLTAIVALVAAAGLAFGIYTWASGSGSGANATHLLPERTYGPAGGLFHVAFGGPVTTPFATDVQEGDQFFGESPTINAYSATLNSNAYEQVQVAVYPHRPSIAEVRRYLGWLTGFQVEDWKGLSGASEDVACHIGTSNTSCPGRIARRVIIDGRSVYEVVGMQVSEGEFDRLLSSFKVG